MTVFSRSDDLKDLKGNNIVDESRQSGAQSESEDADGWYLDELVDSNGDGENPLFLMLKFFMDESGIGKNRDEAVCCIAGFAAMNADWKKFAKHWEALLANYGLDEFHSKEFWARRPDGGLTGKYRGWSFGDANSFMLKAIELIHNYNLFLLGSVVSLRDFFSYSVEDRRLLTGARFDFGRQKFSTTGKPDAAYFVPFNVVVTQGAVIGRDKKQPAHFVFDEQNEFAPRALERIAELRRSADGAGLREFLGSAVYDVSSRLRPLQVADLAAFTCKEYYKRKMRDLPIDFEERAVISPMEVLAQLLREHNHKLFKLERIEMDAMLQATVAPQIEGIQA